MQIIIFFTVYWSGSWDSGLGKKIPLQYVCLPYLFGLAESLDGLSGSLSNYLILNLIAQNDTANRHSKSGSHSLLTNSPRIQSGIIFFSAAMILLSLKILRSEIVQG